MEQKSGKYWPGILLMMLFAVLCARRVLPDLWNQTPWQVIPAQPDPIPLFGNSSLEEDEDINGEIIRETQQQDEVKQETMPEQKAEEHAGKVTIPDQNAEELSEQKEEAWPETMLPGERININKASVADLTRLPLVGEKRARAIAAWRRKNGPFRELEDLLGVQGIGAATLEQLKRYITLQD